MPSLILFLKGILIGIGKIIPGVSGSLIAISLGVYENAIEKINHFWQNKKGSFYYLAPLALGILVAILFSSNIILHFLNTYYVYTMTVFIGLIGGTIPTVTKEIKISWSNLFFILLIFGFCFLFTFNLSLQEFTFQNNIINFLFQIFLGFIESFTTIVPGISGTAIFMMLGSYNFVLSLFSNPFSHLFSCFLFGIGFIIGFILLAKLVGNLFLNHRDITWLSILGFLLFSIFSLVLKIIDFITKENFFPILFLFLLSYRVISLTNHE